MAPSPGEQNAQATPQHHTDQSSQAATTQVLNTVELLERVLLQLSMQDLLLDQRVSKTWKACIDGSPTLQQALFFRPMGDTSATQVDREDVVAYFAELYITSPLVSLRNGTPTLDSILDYTSLNPLLASKCDAWWIARWLVLGEDDGCESGSWQRMLVFQPPLESLGIIPEGFARRSDTLIAERFRFKGTESQKLMSAQGLNKALRQKMGIHY